MDLAMTIMTGLKFNYIQLFTVVLDASPDEDGRLESGLLLF